MGLYGGAAQLMPAMLPLRAVSIIGSYVGSLAEMGELMALARQGRLPAMPVTARPLAEVNEALTALRSGTVRGPRGAATLTSASWSVWAGCKHMHHGGLQRRPCVVARWLCRAWRTGPRQQGLHGAGRAPAVALQLQAALQQPG